ncbi:MAG: hypothetical protein NVSMB9_27520 [Isosphaeraceae bacterium]
MNHRGRVQAQGGGVEESEPWTQDDPLLVADGQQKLVVLRDKLIPVEQAFRHGAFLDAHRFMERAADAGGARAGTKKSYPQPTRKDQRRVDIEVHKGLAFIKL